MYEVKFENLFPIINEDKALLYRGGARERLEGATIPPSEHASSPSESKTLYFFGDFWHLQYPGNRIIAPSSEESAPFPDIPGATPATVCIQS